MPETVMTGESIAALIGMPILILLLLLVGLFFFANYRMERADERAGTAEKYAVITSTGFLLISIAAWIGAVVAIVGFWWGMYPWKWAYHEWRPVTGTVATVDSRIVPAGESGIQDKFVVTFQGDGQQYGVLDTRAATLRPGDELMITCVRRWQWSGTHGYDCNFVSMARGGAVSGGH